MKRISTIIILIVCISNTLAQVPQKMSFQCVIRNTNGVLVSNSLVGIKISIIQGSIAGIAVFIESHTPITNLNGLASIEIGDGTNVMGGMDSINWGAGPYFIKSETDPTGGTNYSISGISELISVPYAFYAATSGNSSNGNYNHYVGELFGGGIIGSVWKEAGVEHGIIASLADISVPISWSNITNSLIGSSAQSSINGQLNSSSIIIQPGHTNSAASLCDVFSNGGFNDWYLPAAWELKMLYTEAFIVNNILENDGNAATTGFEFSNDLYYWSSSEYNASEAHVYLFGYNANGFSGIAAHLGKNVNCNVRATRRF